ncbi:MAG TPA: hypothetical protein ENL12_03305 [Dehalococcoidia bacterium]|nr:hypothetical protein [Dehalococcoidia bacterium]
MIGRAAVIWSVIGLVIALVIDFVTPSSVQVWLYAGFGCIVGGGSWALNNVKKIPQGLVVGVVAGFVVGVLDGTLTSVAASPGTLAPAPFIILKYVATAGIFALVGALPWSLQTR